MVLRPVKSFLNRDIPNIKGKKAGEKIIETENFTDEIPKVINNLNNSYLYLQGPSRLWKDISSSECNIRIN